MSKTWWFVLIAVGMGLVVGWLYKPDLCNDPFYLEAINCVRLK